MFYHEHFIEIKQHVVKRVFQTCTQIAQEYVQEHRNDWRLGGEDTIVLIDLYPDGCAKVSGTDPEYQNNNPTQILCIAEAKVLQLNCWMNDTSIYFILSVHNDNMEYGNSKMITKLIT